MFSTNPELEIEVDTLSTVLKALPMGGVASYASLSEAVGYPVQKKIFALMKARKKVEDETGLRFATVRGEGVKLLPADAIAGIGASVRKGIARKAKRQAARLTGLRYNNIEKGEQARIDAERSLLGAISATARTNVSEVEKQTQTGPVVAARIFDMMNKLD